MTPTLKPCPFCGDDEELRVCQPAHLHGYWAVHCGCCGGEMQAESEGGAITGWNTRARDPDELREALEGVRQLIVDACSLIDTIKVEWSATGHWSEWDASVRERATASIHALDDALSRNRGDVGHG